MPCWLWAVSCPEQCRKFSGILQTHHPFKLPPKAQGSAGPEPPEQPGLTPAAPQNKPLGPHLSIPVPFQSTWLMPQGHRKSWRTRENWKDPAAGCKQPGNPKDWTNITMQNTPASCSPQGREGLWAAHHSQGIFQGKMNPELLPFATLGL